MLYWRSTPRNFKNYTLLLLFLTLLPQAVNSTPYKNYFPEFQCIADNVIFWEKVYGEYSINTAVFHDRENLAIIYEAVHLLDGSLPGASRVNRVYLKTIRNKYTVILDRLADGKKPATSEEERVLKMFAPPDIKEKLKKASQNIRIQTGLKERFIEGVVRSGAYMKEMKQIFRSYNLPEELAYLPHVESSFDTRAYSKFGAAGMWQFTRATGKNFMTIDHIIDERRDPLTSTHAAAQYLKKNFDNLGTWPLAITAYNYGHAGMQRAVQQEGNYTAIFKNYRQGHFKFASRNFYAEFLAALRVAKRLEIHPAVLKESSIANFSIALPGFASAAALADHFNLSHTEMLRLNPSLGQPIWQGEKYIPKGFHLRLPQNAETVRLAATLPGTIFQANQKRSELYLVKQGDTAGKIAQRFGISLQSLISSNNLDRQALVYTGQSLRIPSASTTSIVADASSPRPGSSVEGSGAIILKDGKKTPPT
ncbi:lytic transglycosylase domain-containing protein [Desulfopila inferna]|uniref:lytic transglycosylase domain-containing protein n=1 Tax=Desulfopila inferna TaxID=468528 RepID=UPI0019634DE9|nr:lytic transglycosylase domain-containing protein [Desulfopila inferna]MBM9605240.1 transglycosylase SLT domain-containing protein [Desulfopila inferna]